MLKSLCSRLVAESNSNKMDSPSVCSIELEDDDARCITIALDSDAWIRVWQLPRERVPSRFFTRLWDARPRAPTHVLMKALHAKDTTFHPYETKRLTRSFGVLPACLDEVNGVTKHSYMFSGDVAIGADGADGADVKKERKGMLGDPWPHTVECVQSAVLSSYGNNSTNSTDAGMPLWNQATVNWYRDGTDYMPMHADWTHGAVPHASIVCVTLAPHLAPPRTFELRASNVRSAVRKRRDLQLDQEGPLSVRVATRNGTVIEMGGTTQERYIHGVLKHDAHDAPRINISLRAFES